MTKGQFNAVLEVERSWPEENLQELAEFGREMQARRTGVWMSPD